MRKISGTREWAPFSMNCVSGCSHDCTYCYAKASAASAPKFRRIEPWEWKNESFTPLPEYLPKKKGRIMFPTTHDITPNNVKHCLSFLKLMLNAGNEVLIVSKPHFEVIKTLISSLGEYKEQILFRFTIGSANSEVLKLWEPGAPDFEERLMSLKFAVSNGFYTSISCEPMLDDEIEKVVEAVEPFVTDSIWIGKMNKVRPRLLTNCARQEILDGADRLIEWQRDSRIVEIYEKYKDNPKIKWKESIKEVIGLEGQTEPGQDI